MSHQVTSLQSVDIRTLAYNCTIFGNVPQKAKAAGVFSIKICNYKFALYTYLDKKYIHDWSPMYCLQNELAIVAGVEGDP